LLRSGDQLSSLGLILQPDTIAARKDEVEEAGDTGRGKAQERDRLDCALPQPDEQADMRIVGEARIDFGLVRVMQYIHHVRAADAGRIVKAGILEATFLQILDPLAGPVLHVCLRAEHDGPRRTGLHTGRFQSYADPVGAERALVGLVIGLADARDVERTALHAIAATDTILADEVDDAVGILDDRTGRRAGLQAARILAMHAAILADQPFKIAVIPLPLRKAH